MLFFPLVPEELLLLFDTASLNTVISIGSTSSPLSRTITWFAPPTFSCLMTTFALPTEQERFLEAKGAPFLEEGGFERTMIDSILWGMKTQLSCFL